MGFVCQREEAEDITQEVFIRAYKGLEKFRGDSSVATWLYRITVNVSLNHVTEKKRRTLLQYSNAMFERLFDRKDTAPSPLQEMETSERERIFQNIIDTLPENQRTAFVLSRFDELSQKDIAAIMKTSEGAVEQLLQRAKANLRKKLQNYRKP